MVHKPKPCPALDNQISSLHESTTSGSAITAPNNPKKRSTVRTTSPCTFQLITDTISLLNFHIKNLSSQIILLVREK